MFHVCNGSLLIWIYCFDFLYSIAEYSIENSIIKPTYMLTYESATELLHLNLQEEAELKLLSEAATLRFQWRRRQVSITISMRYKCIVFPCWLPGCVISELVANSVLNFKK